MKANDEGEKEEISLSKVLDLAGSIGGGIARLTFDGTRDISSAIKREKKEKIVVSTA